MAIETNKSAEKIQLFLKRGIVDLDDERFLDISVDDVNEVCKLGIAYKLTSNKLIGKKYLSDKILIAAKEKESQGARFELDSTLISPFIIFEILEELGLQKLLIRKNDVFVVNIEYILSPEAIMNFCRYRIYEITLSDILLAFGFKDEVHKNYGFDQQPVLFRSEASLHCEKVLNDLAMNGCLIRSYNQSIFSAFWNFKKMERK